jgi:hypothetical protein
MKSKVILICLLGISTNIIGQVHYIGLQTGLNISNVYADDDYFKDSEFRKDISFGVNYNLLFQNKISIGADILYIPQGYKVTWGNGYLYDFYNFLNLPIKVGHEIGNRFKVFTKVGISPSVLLKAKMTISMYNDQSQKMNEETFINKDAKKFDFGGIVTLGTEYEFKIFGIMAMADYRYSFTSFTNPIYYGKYTMKHYSINLSIGIKYKLK